MMIDLNLFRVFDAVMTERHVGRAAAKIGRTQPAVSNAIRRLRLRLDDPIFTRTHDGVRPTAKAEKIWRQIGPALDQINNATALKTFGAGKIDGSIAIACTDFEATALLPALQRMVEEKAPNLDIVLRPGGNGLSQEALQSGNADFALGFLPTTSSAIRSRLLFEDSFCVAMRKQHPLAAGKLTVAAFTKARHLLVSPAGERRGFIDDQLESRGLSRRVALVVNQFHLVADALKRSDLVATVSRVLIERRGNSHGLALKELPVTAPVVPISLYWHRRMETDPRHAWLRRQIAALGRQASS